jgi:hypothetical protein
MKAQSGIVNEARQKGAILFAEAALNNAPDLGFFLDASLALPVSRADRRNSRRHLIHQQVLLLAKMSVNGLVCRYCAETRSARIM